jgi:imidazoleglycerol-phosphate dehydratase
MRRATVTRRTNETDVSVTLDLDGTGQAKIASGVGFLDHMLELFARHSAIDIELTAKGDTHVDFHHTTEDSGIVIGQAIRQALGDLKGIRRYADVHLPMDETLTRVALDISGRPFLVWRTEFTAPKVGEFDTELVREFFQGLATHTAMTLHVETFYGVNSHHIAESCFKGVARALRTAVSIDERFADSLPSTKGRLGD